MKVKFVPQNVEFEIKPGESVMHLAEDNGLYVKSVCRGVPSCAECRVRIVEGETNVFAPVAAELALVGSGWFIDRRRLACQLQCIGDVTVDMSEQIAKQQGLIGGRKAKAAKALGDRVEDETVIRESTSGPRSGGRGRSSDADEESAEEIANPRVIAPRAAAEPRPTAPPNNIVIASPGAVSATSPSAGGRIEPRPPGSPQPVPAGGARGRPEGGPSGENRGGRSRRGRRR